MKLIVSATTTMALIALASTTATRAFAQLSTSQAEWVVAHRADIAGKTVEYLKTVAKEAETPNVVVADIVEIIDDAPSEWTFIPRDRGILIGIDVASRVPVRTWWEGPHIVARATEKVIRQERDLPIKSRVTVVLMEPHIYEQYSRLTAYGQATRLGASQITPSFGSQSHASPLGGPTEWFGTSSRDCNCH